MDLLVVQERDRLYVLVEPQHIRRIVFLLDLHESRIVRPVRRPDRLVCLQNMFGHGSQSCWAVNFEWRVPASDPAGKDEIRITRCVIRVEMRHKSDLQIGGLKGRDVPVENSRLRTTHDAAYFVSIEVCVLAVATRCLFSSGSTTAVLFRLFGCRTRQPVLVEAAVV